MAKNTSSSAFRRIDVDEYNEDNYKDDPLTSVGATRLNEDQINGLSMQGRQAEALVYCLKNAPLGCREKEVRDSSTSTVLRLLHSIKQSQMEECVAVLEPDQVDTLMKYIYKGFESPSDGLSSHLLAWHEKTFAVGGLGCIGRVLSDRRRV